MKFIEFMKKSLKKILGIVIVSFILFSIAFILTLPFSILLIALKCFLGNNHAWLSSFWKINFFFSSFTLLILSFLLDKYEANIDKFLLDKFKANIDKFLTNRCLDNKTNKEERETMKTPEIDKEVKQFCYDSSNPCPYCDTKFEHTALHCAVYFSDMERLKELIDLIKKVDVVDDFYDSNSICGKIFDTKDLHSETPLTIAVRMGSIETIKFLFQIIKTKRSGKLEVCVGNNEWIFINPENEETIKELIDSFNYKKKTQTGKDILDKDQEQQDLIKNEHEKRLRGK